MGSGGDDITDNFVSGFIVSCKVSLSEDRDVKHAVLF